MPRILCLAFCLLLSSFTFAESQNLDRQVERLTEAMIKADAMTLKAVTSPKLQYGHSSGRIETQAEFIQSLVSGASDFLSIDLVNQSIELSGDLGLVRHTLEAETLDNGKAGQVRIGVLLVWQESNGHWLLMARQAYKI